MDVFRTYHAVLNLPDGKFSRWFEERAGALLPAAERTAGDPANRLVRLFLALAHFKLGATIRGLETASFLKYAAELEGAVLMDALAADERMNLLAEAILA